MQILLGCIKSIFIFLFFRPLFQSLFRGSIYHSTILSILCQCLYQYYSAVPFISDVIMVGTNIKILPILRHYFKLGLKPAEATGRFVNYVTWSKGEENPNICTISFRRSWIIERYTNFNKLTECWNVSYWLINYFWYTLMFCHILNKLIVFFYIKVFFKN